jgi:hypothetical protein
LSSEVALAALVRMSGAPGELTTTLPMQFNAVVETNAAAVALWRSFGFEIRATVPEASTIRRQVRGVHIMYRRL